MKTDLEQLFENAKVDLTKELKEYLENECSELNEELLLELKREDAGQLLTIAENTVVNAVQTILNLALKPNTKHNSYYIETKTYISYIDSKGNKQTLPLCVITDNYVNRKKNKYKTQPPSAGVKHFAQHILKISDVMYGCMHKRFKYDGSEKETTKTDLQFFIKAIEELEIRLSKNTLLTSQEVNNKENEATIIIPIPFTKGTIKMKIVIGLPKNINTDIAFILTAYENE